MPDTMEIRGVQENNAGAELDNGDNNPGTTENEAETRSPVASTVIETSALVDLTCEEAIDLMGVYLAHEMKLSERDQFVKHIRQCPLCHEKLLALEIYLHIAARLPVTNGEPAGASQ
jgi:hypothetical protein